MTQITPEAASDGPAIRALVTQAFAGAQHSDGTEGALVDALRDAGALPLSLVARRGGRIVGHVAASAVTLDGTDGWFGVGPLAVVPDAQGTGIGGALMVAALDQLRGAGARGVVLVGDPAYYARFGLRPHQGLQVPGIPASHVLGLGFGADQPTGRIAYHPAFGLPD